MIEERDQSKYQAELHRLITRDFAEAAQDELSSIAKLSQEQGKVDKAFAKSNEEDGLTAYTKEQRGLILIGVDEAGRGCMFGPVVAAAALIGFVDYDVIEEVRDVPSAKRVANAVLLQQRYSQDLLGREFKEVGDLTTQQKHGLLVNKAFANEGSESVFGWDLNVKGKLQPPPNAFYRALQLQLDVSCSKDMLSYLAKAQDSKRLSERRRATLYQNFLEQGAKGSIMFAIEEGDVDEIQEKNILHASLAAMSRAVRQVLKQLEQRCEAYGFRYDQILNNVVVLIDGNQIIPNLNGITQMSVVKGDILVREISVASILAKNYRDDLMREMGQLPQYSVYNIEKHKGYVTQEHVQLLFKHGPSDQHRRDYRQVQLAIEQHANTAMLLKGKDQKE
ncbi:ribonuclease HII [Psittacicella gerlachiana]|nr:ribonuclease HII [Psittacicella gerlachiana]